MKSRYNNIDGLRTIAAISIIIMHVLYNGNYLTNLGGVQVNYWAICTIC